MRSHLHVFSFLHQSDTSPSSHHSPQCSLD